MFVISKTSQKVAGSSPDEVIDFFFNLPKPSSECNRNEYQEIFLVVKRGRRKADNLTAVCGPIV
jgi:hypothetical protein